MSDCYANSWRGRRFPEWLNAANEAVNPDLFRIALKLATGAGFLIVTPGITIRDRLRVLMLAEPDNYYRRTALVPSDMMAEMGKAKIVITNYHAFKLTTSCIAS